jgi:hypothetical protein
MEYQQCSTVEATHCQLQLVPRYQGSRIDKQARVTETHASRESCARETGGTSWRGLSTGGANKWKSGQRAGARATKPQIESLQSTLSDVDAGCHVACTTRVPRKHISNLILRDSPAMVTASRRHTTADVARAESCHNSSLSLQTTAGASTSVGQRAPWSIT